MAYIVCRNELISDTRVALGTARNATEAIFRFFPTESAFSIFYVPKSEFLVRHTEPDNRKLGTTPHINSRPPEMHMSALVSTRKPSEVYSELCASSCRFRWKQGGFAL
jgi:hypothetical protein